MKVLRWAKKVAGKIIRLAYHMTYKFVSVDDDLIVFTSFHGRGYTDNPRAIYEQMQKDERFANKKFIWFVKHHKKKNLDIQGAKVVEYFSIPYFYYLSKAKVWVFNCKMPTYIAKKDSQLYLQTWHGTPLKRLGHDIDVSADTTFYRSGISYERMCETYDIDVARYNWMISPNQFCTQVFPGAFGINKERLIETGYPRNDFLSKVTSEKIDELKEKYGLPKDKKVLLYAPTWRDNSYVSAGYTFELQADFKKWKEVLGDEWIVLFKPHYLIINHFKEDKSLEGFLYSIDANEEISQLYPMADALVTDYSSVFFDYAILNRPIYFYMYDLEEYASDLRGFYFDINKDLTGKIYRKEEDMLLDIEREAFDYSHMKAFNARFNNKEDGNASVRVLDVLHEALA
jgi:CDP-glycerol glycerophosphotransferase